MKLRLQAPAVSRTRAASWRAAGSVLIIVLWIAFGLVSVALYFAHSMSYELRSGDQRAAGMEAEQAIAGASRYVSNLLANLDEPGVPPEVETYAREDVPVGESRFWLIGRDTEGLDLEEPVFALADEGAKLNLNTATLEMLEQLPWLTPELAAAIVDWRDTDEEVTSGGAENETYQRLNPAYRCKNGPFESPEELRLVYRMELESLRGYDANLNGVIEPAERRLVLSALSNSGMSGGTGPMPGLLEYVTTFSREPNTRTNGEARVDVTSTNQQALATLLEEKFGTDRANQILQQVGVPGGGGGGPGGGGGGGGGAAVGSELEFYQRSGMTADEFAQIERDITVTNTTFLEGRVNVNTASEAVLACIPGIGLELASTVVAARQSNPLGTASVAWVADILTGTNLTAAGPYVTGSTYVYSVDVAALGRFGRGYRRARLIYDTCEGAPRLVYRRDLTPAGWALGEEVRLAMLQEAKARR